MQNVMFSIYILYLIKTSSIWKIQQEKPEIFLSHLFCLKEVCFQKYLLNYRLNYNYFNFQFSGVTQWLWRHNDVIKHNMCPSFGFDGLVFLCCKEFKKCTVQTSTGVVKNRRFLCRWIKAHALAFMTHADSNW